MGNNLKSDGMKIEREMYLVLCGLDRQSEMMYCDWPKLVAAAAMVVAMLYNLPLMHNSVKKLWSNCCLGYEAFKYLWFERRERERERTARCGVCG